MTVVQLGGYRLLERLGKGSIGTVYRCRHEETGREAALRVLAEGIRWDPELRRQLAAECRSVTRLKHANISTLQDFGEEHGIAYTVSEFLAGRSLEYLIRGETVLPVEAATSLLIQATEGLAFAHRHGIVHLDLRPGNLHLTPEGSLKVCDFGIGRLLLGRTSPPAIRWGSRIYLSPEQIEGKPADERADVFSLGLAFYELLTLTHPFHDENSGRALDHILFTDQVPAIEKHPLYPLGLWPLLDRCLAKDPGERHQTMEELGWAARQLLADTTEDSRLMRAEIQAFLPRLRESAAGTGAPPGLPVLLREAEELASPGSDSDYMSLNRLLSEISEFSRAIQTSRPEREDPDLSILARIAFEGDRALPSLETGDGPGVVPDPAPEPPNDSSRMTAEAREQASGAGFESPAPVSPPAPASEVRPPAGAVESPTALPESRSHHRRGLRMTLAAAALLLAAIAWVRPGITDRVAGVGASGLESVSKWVDGARAGYDRLKRGNVRTTVRILMHQARLLRLEGRYDEAKMFLARVLELDPENAEARAEWAASGPHPAPAEPAPRP